jgi:aspartyl-tRNA(Asn)/glutamyl-tRNA(Gln) amidotransferase subunit B
MVRYLGVCDGNMEEGSLRADANISINLPGAGLGRKVEIKNLNSSRFVRLGLNYEAVRQARVLDEGKTVTQETRLWNENRDQTEPMRSKENAKDYRFFPEPDLPVFTPDASVLQSVDAGIVELPQARLARVAADYGLSPGQAGLLTDEKAFVDYFEDAVAACVGMGMETKEAARVCANWLLTDIKHQLSLAGVDEAGIAGINLTPDKLAAIVVMQNNGSISGKTAKLCACTILDEGGDPQTLVSQRGWLLIRDPQEIAKVLSGVKAAEAAAFAEFAAVKAAGNAKRAATLRAYLVGKVLAATQGRADPEAVGKQIDAGGV